MKILTNETILAVAKESIQKGEILDRVTDFGEQLIVPRSLGTGDRTFTYLRKGINIEIANASLLYPAHIFERHKLTVPLTAKFYLSGNSRTRTVNVKDSQFNYEELEGHNYLVHLPDVAEVGEWPANRVLHVVIVRFEATYFQALNFKKNDLPQPLQRLLAGDTRYRFHQSLGKITPIMRQVLQQLLNCPYQGTMRQLYLESKAIELLTLQFAHWAECRQQSPITVDLHSEDIERLHFAREILLDNILNPPSLLDIARKVGLNDCTLKQGFRQLFGTTVFGYLYDYRMQQARQLLLNPNLSIAGVAAKVGYSNPEAFSTAFRRKFAITPKAYQLGK
ncbi:MAG: AraC family transcriptional regulator [Cyanobacteria bacterium P01_E01_bin.42]